MKKIIATLTLLLAFSVSVNAQAKKMSNQELAQKDAIALCDYLNIQGSLKADFARLFEMKYEVFNNPEASMERKIELARIMKLKIEASLDGTQLEKLNVKKDFFMALTGENQIAEKKK